MNRRLNNTKDASGYARTAAASLSARVRQKREELRHRNGAPVTTRTIVVRVNGQPVEREVPVRRTLGDLLREDLNLTGTHFGCEHGVCGACTVQVNGQAIRSCLMLAVQADGSDIKTIEGMAAEDGTMHPIQQSFWDHKGQQCGFCTPGMIMSADDLLVRRPCLSRDEIREEMQGNICRCTGYQFIVDSIEAAAAVLDGREPPVRQHHEDEGKRCSHGG